jgi:hypothetical protein
MPTMTYDPTVPGEPEFTPDELDSLQVGENLQEAEAQLLAGKYENAQQLEKAYLELQTKLGSNESDSDAEVDDAEDYSEETEEAEDLSPVQQVIQDASTEWYANGELTEETLDQFKSMNSTELVEAYLAMQDTDALPEMGSEGRDLSDQEVNQIVNFAGGEQEYSAITEWAGENMAEEYIDAFDSIVDSGDPAVIQLALAGLMATYYEQNGYEGRMYTGKGAADQGAPVFRSQAEVVAAMNDPRYDTDPAYRNDVFEALDRSNIEF